MNRANAWALRLLAAMVGALVLVKVPVNTGLKLLVVVQLATLVEIMAVARQPSQVGGVRLGANILSGGLFAAFLLLCLTSLERPFLPIFLVSTLVAALWAWSASGGIRALWVNVAVVAATLSIAEAIWAGVLSHLVGKPEREEIVVTERSTGRRLAGGTLMAPDPIRGFAGPEGCEVRVRRARGSEVLADVTYTIGVAGMRETGKDRITEPVRRALFLGDSFAFGEGVADGETAPAQLERLAPDVATVNLAFKGYGPHQALATLENRLESRVSPEPYSFAVYYAYLDLNRAAGRAPWDGTGPRYVTAIDGGVAFAGSFTSSPRLRAIALLNRGFIFRKAISRFFVSDRDVELFARILSRTGELFRERYQGRFLLLLWGETGERRYERSLVALRSRALEVHTVQQVFPEADESRGQWSLPDGHPNAAAQRRVAEYLARALRAE